VYEEHWRIAAAFVREEELYTVDLGD